MFSPFIAGVVAIVACINPLLGEELNLQELAEKSRPGIMLLVVSDKQDKPVATATGFLLSSEGLLATNYHVIAGAGSIIAKAENGGLFIVDGIVATDEVHDLAILKLKAKNLQALPLGSSKLLKAGSRVAVIGSPLGLEGTLSDGIVSATRESEDHDRLLQITASISPGSSGSPVMGGNGEVVGVATSALARGQSLNFAITVEHLKDLLAKAPARAHPFPASIGPTDTGTGSGLQPNEDESPLLTTRRYFVCLNYRNVNAAYDLLSSNFRARVAIPNYSKNFSSTLSLKLSEVRIIAQSHNAASVFVDFNEMDAEAGLVHWRGPIELVLESSGWRINTLKNLKVQR